MLQEQHHYPHLYIDVHSEKEPRFHLRVKTTQYSRAAIEILVVTILLISAILGYFGKSDYALYLTMVALILSVVSVIVRKRKEGEDRIRNAFR